MKIENYELIDVIIRDDELETYKARDLSTLKEIILHTLRGPEKSDSGKPSLKQLLKLVVANGGAPELLFAGELQDKLCLVMEKYPDCYNIRQWLERHSQLHSPASVAAAQPTPPSSQPVASLGPEPAKPIVDEGEFTTLFRKPPVIIPNTSTSQPPAPVADKVEKPVPAAVSSEQSEFDKMFDAHDLNAPASEGDFTRMFSKVNQSAQVPPPVPLPILQPDEQTDFSALFAKHGVSSAPEIPVPAAPQPSMDAMPVSPKAKDAGEFTKLFGTAPLPQKPVQRASVPVFDPPLPSDEPLVAATPAPAPPSATAPPAVAPGQVPFAAKPSYLPLILIGAGLFLAALILILYFALKRG